MVFELDIPNLKLVTQEKHINGAAARNVGIKMPKENLLLF